MFVNTVIGGVVLPSLFLEITNRTSPDLINQAIDLGFRAFDFTSNDAYRTGQGVAQAGLERSDVFLQMKMGMKSTMTLKNTEYQFEMLYDQALTNFDTTYIDTVLLPRPTIGSSELEKTQYFDTYYKAAAKEVKNQRAFYLGVFGADTRLAFRSFQAQQEDAWPRTFQSMFLFFDWAESVNLRNFCRKRKVQCQLRLHPTDELSMFVRYMNRDEKLQEIATNYSAPVSQLFIRYLLSEDWTPVVQMCDDCGPNYPWTMTDVMAAANITFPRAANTQFTSLILNWPTAREQMKKFPAASQASPVLSQVASGVGKTLSGFSLSSLSSALSGQATSAAQAPVQEAKPVLHLN